MDEFAGTDFASPPADGEAPIVLGPPADDMDMGGAPADDQFVGTVDETPAAEPIILMGAPEGGVEDVEDEELPEPEQAIVPSGPSPMQEFNEEWQKILLERKEEENSKKGQFVTDAEGAMKTFQDQRETKREAKMATNRSDEQEKLEAIEADLENDNSWQRVCKMVELTHDSADDGADVKRMRDVMILLKNEPNRATVLA